MNSAITGREKDAASYSRLDDPIGTRHGLLRHVVAVCRFGTRQDLAAFRYAHDAQEYVKRQADPTTFEVRVQGRAMVGVSGHGYAILDALGRDA